MSLTDDAHDASFAPFNFCAKDGHGSLSFVFCASVAFSPGAHMAKHNQSTTKTTTRARESLRLSSQRGALRLSFRIPNASLVVQESRGAVQAIVDTHGALNNRSLPTIFPLLRDIRVLHTTKACRGLFDDTDTIVRMDGHTSDKKGGERATPTRKRGRDGAKPQHSSYRNGHT